MGLENLNSRAAKQFDELKRKKGWTEKVVSELAQADSSIDNDKFQKLQKMLNETPKTRVEVDDIVHHMKDKFDSAVVEPLAFIDSLELPANLSIAIACLISYKKKGNKKSLSDAVDWIRKELENG